MQEKTRYGGRIYSLKDLKETSTNQSVDLICTLTLKRQAIKISCWPGAVAHACNANTLRGQGGWNARAQEFETSQAKMVKPHLYQKYEN